LLVDLKATNSVGLTGPGARCAALARAMLLQAAVHHGPDDLLLLAFLSEARLGEWSWLKWLPHARPQRTTDAGQTMIAYDAAQHEQLGRWLLHELANRRRLLEDSSRAGTDATAFPWLLIFVEDVDAQRGDPGFQMALAEGSVLRVAI